jgi:hypothetical protein
MLAGWIDVAQRNRVAGWAARHNSPGLPVMLDLSIAPTLRAPARSLGRILANRYRADRDAEGTGTDGRSGFDVDLGSYSLPSGTFLLDIRDAATGDRLPGAPQFIPGASFAPPPGPLLLSELDGSPVWRLPDDVVVCQPRRDGPLRIDLPPGAAGVMICTRARMVPGDARRLGAVVSRIALDDQPIDLDHPALAFGFHGIEGEPGHHWRWIDDAAFIAIAAPAVLEVDLHSLAPMPGKEIDTWRLSASYRLVSRAVASVPSIGSRLLAPPLSPAKRRPSVHPGFS